MNNNFQQSIARARAKIGEGNRLAAKMVRDIRRNKERANTNLELLLDELVAETGIELKTENMPTIMIFVQQFLEDQKRKEPDGDVDGMKDYGF
jgi:hypothetical protein